MSTAGEAEEIGEALAAAFVQHRPALVRFLKARLGSLDAAEDLAQEAYVRSAGTREGVRNPRAFLFQVAANLLRNQGRADRRRAALAEYADLLFDDDEARNPERTLLAREALGRVRVAIRRLPPQAQRVFRLARFEGLTQREIADRLGVSQTAVEKSLRRAFAQLVDAAQGQHAADPKPGRRG